MKQIDSIARHQTGALFLAAALYEMFPRTPLYSGGGTDRFFFCDSDFSSPLTAEMLSLLEEKIRLFLKKSSEIEVVEMMTQNAARYFAQEGKIGIAECLEDLESATVTLYRVEGSLFYLPLPESFIPLKKREMTPLVRLVFHGNVERNGRSLTRLLGVWAENKEELKKKVKEKISFHQEVAKKLSLTFLGPSGWVWAESGVAFRDCFSSFFSKEGIERKFSILSGSPFIGLEGGEAGVIKFYLETLGRLPAKRAGSFFFLQEEGVSEGFLSPEIASCDRSALLCSEENFFEEMISSLQFILQIPKILDFEYELVVVVSSDAPKKARSEALATCEKALGFLERKWRVEKISQLPYLVRVEVRIRDLLGRYWLGPFVGIASAKAEMNKVIFFSLYYSLERMIALCLEREQGVLSLQELKTKLKQE